MHGALTRFDLTTHGCGPEDVERVAAFRNHALAEISGATADVLRERLARNPDIVACVSRGDEGRELRGFGIAYPLNAEARRLVEAGVIAKSAQIRPEHIAPATTAAAAVYVSLVIGADRRASAAVLAILKANLESLGRDCPHALRVFARPASGSGLHAVLRRRFVPLATAPGVYCYDFPAPVAV